MFDLTEPTSSGRATEWALPYVACNASASIGSPILVPVPCASTTSTSPATQARIQQSPVESPAAALDRSGRTAHRWLRPVRRRCPGSAQAPGNQLLRACDSLASTSTPAPSAAPNPSAAAANGLDRPSADSAPCRPRPMKTLGEHTTVAPPATATSHSPDRNDCMARCTETRA